MMRLWVAVWAARLVGLVSRISGRGGSSLPGMVARRIDPLVLSKLVSRLSKGVILLTGTNGKTTTAALAASLLQCDGHPIVHNQAGANLIVGLTSTMVQAEKWRVYPRAALALLETDEASMPRAGQETHPRAIVVTNFFRDQLDRYGELSTTVGMVRKAISQMASDGWLVLNADDPQVAFLGQDQQHVIYFGLDLPVNATLEETGDDVVDARFCPRCGQALRYRQRYYAHLGDYSCPNCGWSRPIPHWTATLWDKQSHIVTVRHGNDLMELPMNMPGIYNVYNLVGAVAAAMTQGLPAHEMGRCLEHFEPAFGRMEQVMIRDHQIWLALVKNPVGFTQVLEAVGDWPESSKWALIAINDRYADGQDVSWLWDVDFETLGPRLGIDQWWVSGMRAYDMALRLKYAGIPDEKVHVVENPNIALDMMVDQSTRTVTIYVMPTYTALLDLRQHLTQKGYTRHFREG